MEKELEKSLKSILKVSLFKK